MVRGLSIYAAIASARRIVVDQGAAKADEVCCLCFEETGTATNWKVVSFPDDPSAALQGASFMDCRKDQGDGTSKCAAACSEQGFEMKGCNKGSGMSEWRENELWATGTWSCETDADGDSCGCPESSLIEQQNSRSFPTAIWDEVEDESPSCEELMGEAQGRMKDYMQTCGLNPQTDRDSGATSFTLFKSGAEKLCNCGLDTESIKDAAKAMADCPTNQMSGPLKVLDNTYLECKAGSLKLSDYKEKDGKLADEGSLIAVKEVVAGRRRPTGGGAKLPAGYAVSEDGPQGIDWGSVGGYDGGETGNLDAPQLLEDDDYQMEDQGNCCWCKRDKHEPFEDVDQSNRLVQRRMEGWKDANNEERKKKCFQACRIQCMGMNGAMPQWEWASGSCDRVWEAGEHALYDSFKRHGQ